MINNIGSDIELLIIALITKVIVNLLFQLLQKCYGSQKEDLENQKTEENNQKEAITWCKKFQSATLRSLKFVDSELETNKLIGYLMAIQIDFFIAFWISLYYFKASFFKYWISWIL